MLMVELYDNFMVINAHNLADWVINKIIRNIFEGKKVIIDAYDGNIYVHDVTYADIMRLNEHYKILLY